MFRLFQWSERALQFGLVQMYDVQGVSTWKMTEVTETLFGTQISAMTISNFFKGARDEEIAEWLTRPLGFWRPADSHSGVSCWGRAHIQNIPDFGYQSFRGKGLLDK